ncbi:enoyl-CoA hydratase/isomerase family protein [Colwellia sp. 1_MG-2023]|uniref:enoyl-CoA hydratase/isomerase family protein n=1 Tax=Colwellia sp. 1_MG-2023 TaxID=3062649 RepID=UPI0026E41990|nr:enoyl-CoA hydratase/isomerase family protein [Colwellia sp. 1_MG-2023]MDO6446000.1 enoyl-CoA hydratase/isomerase family protein [Colwellia sp. 1_MG-2023]
MIQPSDNSPVILTEQLLDSGVKVAFATLNARRSLNALSLPMIDFLLPQVKSWLADDGVAAIVFQGAGDKAFCAGGDVVSVYHDLVAKHKINARNTLNDDEISSCLGVEFFTKEYQLDQLIHHASKPILMLADGYVMGGGIGLVAGANHRIVTEKTVMAMPEITIGLYPDVGASWFLNQMPKGVGLFLGLTGMTFTGADAKRLKMADYSIDSEHIPTLIDSLLKLELTTNESINHQLLSDLVNSFAAKSEMQIIGQIDNEIARIQSVTAYDNVVDIYHAIVDAENCSDWFNKAKQNLMHGSPLSAHIIYQQLNHCQGLSLAECFEQEFNLSIRCCQFSEFTEGVRALLVDKDKQPNWFYKSIESVDKQQVAWFFTTIKK